MTTFFFSVPCLSVVAPASSWAQRAVMPRKPKRYLRAAAKIVAGLVAIFVLINLVLLLGGFTFEVEISHGGLGPVNIGDTKDQVVAAIVKSSRGETYISPEIDNDLVVTRTTAAKIEELSSARGLIVTGGNAQNLPMKMDIVFEGERIARLSKSLRARSSEIALEAGQTRNQALKILASLIAKPTYDLRAYAYIPNRKSVLTDKISQADKVYLYNYDTWGYGVTHFDFAHFFIRVYFKNGRVYKIKERVLFAFEL